MGPKRRVLFYLWGYAQVFLHAASYAVVGMWLLQIGAMLTQAWSFDALAVLLHLFATFSFLLFFPGQRYWTHTRLGPDGKTYVIVGEEGAVDP